MQTIFLNLNNLYKFIDSLSITIGAYDGIHRGHLVVLNNLIINKENDKTAVFTFDIHPDYLLNKANNLGMVNLIDEKKEIFEKMNIDFLVVLPKEILKMEADSFNKLLKSLNVRRIVVGSDFIYGANKSGDIKTLQKDFLVNVIDIVEYKNKKISSSDIRLYLSEGLFDQANELLIDSFVISGIVSHGSNIGEKLGFKTANLEMGDKFYNLKSGVYKVKVQADGETYLGVANFGVNPTCNLINKPRLEVHILDFDKDIYNKRIDVEFIKYLREEKKFSSQKELINQINLDIKNVKEN